VMATHRPALLALADRILHTQDGAITEIRNTPALAMNDTSLPGPSPRFPGVLLSPNLPTLAQPLTQKPPPEFSSAAPRIQQGAQNR